MATASSYAPLRDDATLRSLSTNERAFLRASCCASSSTTSADASAAVVVRADGRHPTETRPIRLTFGRSSGSSSSNSPSPAPASAECTARLGSGTRVTATVTATLTPPPNRDRPNDGQVRFGVELTPMAAVGFAGAGMVYSAASGDPSAAGAGGAGAPLDDSQRLLTNRILRTLERTLLTGGAIDSEALCVQSAKWVWRLSVDVAILDHGGNLVDAAVLASVAALRHFRKPEVELGDGDAGPVVLNTDEREPSPLPLHHTPLAVTFALFSNRADTTGSHSGGSDAVLTLIDPTEREELVSDGTVTLSYNKHGELCGLDYPGGTELKPRQLVGCAKLGERRCLDWCEFLEEALGQAEEKAGRERMERLKRAAAAAAETNDEASALPAPDVTDGEPYVERTDHERDGDMMDVDDGDLVGLGSDQAAAAAAAQAAAEEEEKYRLRALDYAVGHVAARVKEDGGKGMGNGEKKDAAAAAASSLMGAMLAQAERAANGRGGGGGGGGSAPAASASVTRTAEADEEFEKYAASAAAAAAEAESQKKKKLKKEKKKAIKAPVLAGSDEDDEEEDVTTSLHSEFSSIAPASTSAAATAAATASAEKKKSEKQQIQVQEEDNINDDYDVDDLAMAVKKKKKKDKKSKKTKKGK